MANYVYFISSPSLAVAGEPGKRHAMPVHNNNNNNITSLALKSTEARAQKSNKTKSVIIFKSRGHTGVIISLVLIG